jgi:hypothetical protein
MLCTLLHAVDMPVVNGKHTEADVKVDSSSGTSTTAAALVAVEPVISDAVSSTAAVETGRAAITQAESEMPGLMVRRNNSLFSLRACTLLYSMIVSCNSSQFKTNNDTQHIHQLEAAILLKQSCT